MAAVVLVCAGVSCETKGEQETAKSLDISESSLTFEAVAVQPITVTVTAVNVTWDFTVSEAAKAWLHAERNGEQLVITADENVLPEERKGSVSVIPEEEGRIKRKTISVTQAAANIEYEFSVKTTSLEFAAEEAEPQTVEVIATGGDLVWTAVPEEAAAQWITVESGEGGFTVSVADNPDTEVRSGKVFVTPSVESLGVKTVNIVQREKVLPPSLSVTPESLHFEYNPRHEYLNLVVTAVNTDWTVAAVDEAGEPAGWLTVLAVDSRRIRVSAQPNGTKEDRDAFVVVVPEAEGVDEVRIPVHQTSSETIMTTLTGDLEGITLTGGMATVFPAQVWADVEMTKWTLTLWSDGVSYSTNKGQYTGTGDRLNLQLCSERINFNDDGVYYLPEGTYTVRKLEEGEAYGAQDIEYPKLSTTGHPKLPIGAWYTALENDAFTEQAPLAAGTLTVVKSGETYEFTFDFEDDLGYRVQGTYSGTIALSVFGRPVPEPSETM